MCTFVVSINCSFTFIVHINCSATFIDHINCLITFIVHFPFSHYVVILTSVSLYFVSYIYSLIVYLYIFIYFVTLMHLFSFQSVFSYFDIC